MRLTTASGLDRALACIGGEALPGIDATSEDNAHGTAVHAYLHDAQTLGKGPALVRVEDDELRAACEAIDLSRIPPGAEAEVAFAWDPETGKAERLKLDGPRGYPDDGRFYGTADLAGVLASGAAVVVDDYKTGALKRRATESMQLRGLALFASSLTSKDWAHVSMLYLRHDGRFYQDRAEFDPMDLEEIADRLRRLKADILRARGIVADGGPMALLPELHAGPWCEFCPSLRFCPAQRALVVTAAGGELAYVADGGAEEMTLEKAGELFERVVVFEKLVDAAKKALKAMASVRPLPLSGGKELREISFPVRSFVPRLALPVLREKYSPALADAAVTLSAKGIERAFTEDGKTVAEAKAAIEEVARAGGAVMKKQTQVRAVAARAVIGESANRNPAPTGVAPLLSDADPPVVLLNGDADPSGGDLPGSVPAPHVVNSASRPA